MSDRIDELVAEAAFLDDSGCDKCEIVTELATIALKAEAMCEWLAEELVDSGWCRPDGERENAPCQEDGETCCECALKAAEEAVRR